MSQVYGGSSPRNHRCTKGSSHRPFHRFSLPRRTGAPHRHPLAPSRLKGNRRPRPAPIPCRAGLAAGTWGRSRQVPTTPRHFLKRCRIAKARPGSASRTRTPVSGRRAVQPAGAPAGGAMTKPDQAIFESTCGWFCVDWVALMTGSFLVAVYAILPLVFPDTRHRKYLWNHLPPWAGWTLAVLAVVTAQYLAWSKVRDERERAQSEVERLKAERPLLVGCLHEETEQPGNLWLAVTNGGAPAKVWAAITVAGDTTKPCSGVDAVWRHVQVGRCDLGTEETRYIKLAVMLPSGRIMPQTFNWHVPFIAEGEECSTFSKRDGGRTSADYNPKTDALASRQRITLEVFSTPASLSRPIRCNIVLVGCDAWEDLAGVSVCGPSIPAPPPADQLSPTPSA